VRIDRGLREYITWKRRIALRDAVGSILVKNARACKYANKDAKKYEHHHSRFLMAVQKLIELHAAIPDNLTINGKRGRPDKMPHIEGAISWTISSAMLAAA
jgi:hypothetical protein